MAMRSHSQRFSLTNQRAWLLVVESAWMEIEIGQDGPKAGDAGLHEGRTNVELGTPFVRGVFGIWNKSYGHFQRIRWTR